MTVPFRRLLLALAASSTLWVAAWLWASRHAMLDDSLIHLRYAANLHTLHRLTYNQTGASFGTSSLAYVLLLSLLRGLTTNPLLPKLVSTVFYGVLLATLGTTCWRLRQVTFARWTGIALLVCILSPMGVRWLSDGMETSLVVCIVVLLALATQRAMHAKRVPGRRAVQAMQGVALACLGALLVLTRIELAVQVALASLAIVLAQFASGRGLARSVAIAAPLPAGSCVAMAWVYFHFHRLLPDTAIAKAGGPPLSVLTSVAHVLASSMLLGVGALTVWIVSAGLLLLRRVDRKRDWGSGLLFLAGNAGFPAVVLLSSVKGQAIQGVRYVLWALVYSIVWNAVELYRDGVAHPQPIQLSLRLRALPIAGLVFAALLLPFDWHYAWKAMAGRSATFEQMQHANLGRLRGTQLIAGDVGFIGYFSDADVCDINGLVNGPVAAGASAVSRGRQCVAQHPAALFLTDGQAAFVGQWLDLSRWKACRSFDFTNVQGNDRHALLVPASHADAECQTLLGAFSASPVSRPAAMGTAALTTRLLSSWRTGWQTGW